MKSLLYSIILAITICSLYSCNKHEDSTTPTPPPVTGPYFPNVRTIVQDHCISCHSPGGAGMPVLLNTDELIVQHATAIKAAVADPVSPVNKRMPLGGTLSATDINTIVSWYNAGGTVNVSKTNPY